MSEQEVHIDGTAPFLNSAAFNTYWTYNQSTKNTFFELCNPKYQYLMETRVKQWAYWYNGWVPYFHNANNGIFSTHLATSIVNRLTDKVCGGQLMFKNSGKETGGETNKALEFISTKWAQKTDFAKVRNLAVKYAGALGTSLIKLNGDKKGLWAEALRMDSFSADADSKGKITKVICLLQAFTNAVKDDGESNDDNYYLVEERYFGDWKKGKVTFHNRPLVIYHCKRSMAMVGTGQSEPIHHGENIEFKRLPKNVRKAFLDNYSGLIFDTPQLLPFKDYLGCELVRWTDCISDIPNVPFGESILAPVISYLMAYDYYFSAQCTNIYTARDRVLMPKTMTGQGATKTDGTPVTNYNAGYDSFLYQQYPSTAKGVVNGEPEKPIVLQFDIRSSEWRATRDIILENIALNIGVNSSTLAGFLQDSAPKTATEISVDENETASYINTERTILEKPFNRLLKAVTKFYGYIDTVELRWSSAGLTNRKSLVDIISVAKNNGFLSQEKAVQMFNFDDDSAQIAEELEKIKAEQKAQQDSYNPFADAFGGEGSLPQ